GAPLRSPLRSPSWAQAASPLRRGLGPCSGRTAAGAAAPGRRGPGSQRPGKGLQEAQVGAGFGPACCCSQRGPPWSHKSSVGRPPRQYAARTPRQLRRRRRQRSQRRSPGQCPFLGSPVTAVFSTPSSIRPRPRPPPGTPAPAGPAPAPALPPGPRPGRGRSRLEPPRAPSPPAPPRPLAFLFPARPPGFRAPPATNPLATMSVELEEALPLTTAEGAAKKAAKAGGSAALSPSKKRKNKKKNQPGKYSQLVVETIRRLGERNGSSLAKIYTEAKKVAWFDQQNGRTYLKYSIKALVQNDTLLQVKGTGANGSFKLNRKKLEGGGERRGATAAATAPAPAAHKTKKPVKGQKPEKRSHKKGAAPRKDKGSKAKKVAAAGGKKVKKAAKPSVPKVPKGRK
uniref:H1.10 linker histone n=1 Tax=Equus caballus TaxID=9796 RepID=A0A9L0RBP9_HORSE